VTQARLPGATPRSPCLASHKTRSQLQGNVPGATPLDSHLLLLNLTERREETRRENRRRRKRKRKRVMETVVMMMEMTPVMTVPGASLRTPTPLHPLLGMYL